MCMKKNKISVKEELKEELREAGNINYNPEDLILDENIDDKYTSSVFNKVKNNKGINKWFAWSGYLAIIFGAICVVTMIIIGIMFLTSSEQLKQLAIEKGFDYEYNKNVVIGCSIGIPIYGLITILLGLRVRAYSKYEKRDLIDSLGSIVFVTILQVIFGGALLSVFTAVGYFMGISGDYGAIYYNKIDNPYSKNTRLLDAKKMFQNGLIDEQEYTDLKSKILNNIYDEY